MVKETKREREREREKKSVFSLIAHPQSRNRDLCPALGSRGKLMVGCVVAVFYHAVMDGWI